MTRNEYSPVVLLLVLALVLGRGWKIVGLDNEDEDDDEDEPSAAYRQFRER